jgi:hypothetical protein
VSSGEPVEPLNLEVLDGGDYDQDGNEPPVVPEFLEYVEISLSDLSAVDLVKYLQEHESREYYGEKSQFIFGI